MSARPVSALPRLAQVAIAVTGAVFLWTAAEAVRVTRADDQRQNATGTPSSAPVGLRAPLDESAIVGAVAHDLFSPQRAAPVRRYTLNEAELSVAAAAAGDTQPVEAPLLPTVQGTAVNAAGEGFAMCAMAGGPVVVVRPGDVIGDFTVVSIERTRVVFRDALGRRHAVAAVGSPSGDES